MRCVCVRACACVCVCLSRVCACRRWPARRNVRAALCEWTGTRLYDTCGVTLHTVLRLPRARDGSRLVVAPLVRGSG